MAKARVSKDKSRSPGLKYVRTWAASLLPAKESGDPLSGRAARTFQAVVDGVVNVRPRRKRGAY